MRLIFSYLIVLFTTLVWAKPVAAQEDPTNRQYLFNLLNINPAYAGARGGLSITTGFRKQWAGVPGSPQTSIFSVDGSLNEHHMGVGVQLYKSSLGLEKTTGINASFATHLNFAEDEFLSLGLQAGLMNYRIDRTSVALPFQDDPAFQFNTNVVMPTAGVGVYYQRPGFYASFSAPSLLVSTVKVDKIISINSPSIGNMQLLFTTGITANMGDAFQIKPSVYLRWIRGKVFDVHINSSIWYKDLISVGASYRADDAVLGIFEFKINDKLHFGYSYAQSIADRGVFGQGSHEALIRLDLRREE